MKKISWFYVIGLSVFIQSASLAMEGDKTLAMDGDKRVVSPKVRKKPCTKSERSRQKNGISQSPRKKHKNIVEKLKEELPRIKGSESIKILLSQVDEQDGASGDKIDVVVAAQDNLVEYERPESDYRDYEEIVEELKKQLSSIEKPSDLVIIKETAIRALSLRPERLSNHPEHNWSYFAQFGEGSLEEFTCAIRIVKEYIDNHEYDDKIIGALTVAFMKTPLDVDRRLFNVLLDYYYAD